MTLRVRTVSDRPYGEVYSASLENRCYQTFWYVASAVPYNLLTNAD